MEPNRSAATVDTAINYGVLTCAAEVALISPEWDALLARSPCNRAFSCSTWFLAACGFSPDLTPYLDSPLQPNVIVARRGNQIAGILPLALSPDHEEAGFPGTLSDYNDIVAIAGDTQIATGLLEFAASRNGAYSRLVLKCLRTDSLCLRAAGLLDSARAIDNTFESDQTVCPYLDIASGYEEYLKTRPGGFLKRLRYLQKKGLQSDVLARELDTKGISPDQVADSFLSLHLSRFGSRTGFRNAPVQSFLRRLLPALYAEGRMRVFALFERDRIIGIHLCIVGVDSLCLWSGGFLPEAAHLSPGMLLINTEIETACAEGFAEYDLMRGTESYKERWSTNTRVIRQLEFDMDTAGA